jgi:dTDP-4-amino-4,6-dideoxygalactose transaminase
LVTLEGNGHHLIKLPYLNRINKQKLATIYLENLDKSYIKPVVAEDFGNVYHIFNIRHSERDRIKAYLHDAGIGTEIHYPVTPHNQRALKTMNNLHFPISSEIHATTLSLPCSFAHDPEQIYRVVDILKSLFK